MMGFLADPEPLHLLVGGRVDQADVVVQGVQDHGEIGRGGGCEQQDQGYEQMGMSACLPTTVNISPPPAIHGPPLFCTPVGGGSRKCRAAGDGGRRHGRSARRPVPASSQAKKPRAQRWRRRRRRLRRRGRWGVAHVNGPGEVEVPGGGEIGNIVVVLAAGSPAPECGHPPVGKDIRAADRPSGIATTSASVSLRPMRPWLSR
jgi:hypothetical protein